jgi:hypothetical protein
MESPEFTVTGNKPERRKEMNKDTNCKLIKKSHWRRQYRAKVWLEDQQKFQAEVEKEKERVEREEKRKERRRKKRLEREMARKREQHYRKNELRVSLAEALVGAMSESC